MPHYVVPSKGDPAELVSVLQKAGVKYVSVSSVREYILETEGSPVTVLGVDAPTLMVLNRHAATLLTETPTVIIGVPGLLYLSEFMTTGASLYSMSWVEFSSKVARSGTLATTPEQLAKRDNGTPDPGFERGGAASRSVLESLRSLQAPQSRGPAAQPPVVDEVLDDDLDDDHFPT